MVVDLLAWGWLALLLVGQPVAAFRGRGRVATERSPRRSLYRSTALGIALIGAVSWALDLMTGRGATLAVLLPLGRGRLLGWSVATVAGCAVFWGVSMSVRRWAGRRPADAVTHLLPRTPGETAAFAGVAFLAGVAEEMAFRGFAFFQVVDLTGSVVAAAVCVTVAFALGHAYQGPAGILRSGVVGALLLIPLLATGSLVPSMTGHATVDLLTGFWMLPLLRRWGLDDLGPAAPTVG